MPDEARREAGQADRAGDGGGDRVPVRGERRLDGDGLRHGARVGAEDRRRERARQGQPVQLVPGRRAPTPTCNNPSNPADGTAFTAFLGTLNNGTSSDGTATSGCFAGHCDWRLPAIEELEGIVHLAAPGCSTVFEFGPLASIRRCSARGSLRVIGRPLRPAYSRSSRGAWTSTVSSWSSARAPTTRSSPSTFGRCGRACDRVFDPLIS